jgi:hypothetical protein
MGFDEIGATLKVLQDHGVTIDHLTKLCAEPDYARRVAEFISRGGLDVSIDQRIARAVMNENFFSVDDWLGLCGVNFSPKQLRQVVGFPWREEILNSTCLLCGEVVRDCHFAFVGPDRVNGKPLTILKLHEFYPLTGQPRFYSYAPGAWYSRQDFAGKTTMAFRWYLLHREIVPRSEDKTFNVQRERLPVCYEAPLAVTEILKDLLVFCKTGVRVKSLRRARCADIASHGSNIAVGAFGEDGLGIGSFPDTCFYDIGIAASRKPGF